MVPGFVDVHVHGGGGASFDGGDPDAVATVVRTHLAHGTTTMVASLVTDRSTGSRRPCSRWPRWPTTDSSPASTSRGRGCPRATPARTTRPCSSTRPRRRSTPLVEAARGHLRMVTLAPELPGGLDAVRRLAAAGVTVAIGHTDATYDEARAALDSGATVGTHLFNAMRQLHHREPGPVAALLEHPDAYVELIADGVHLHPAVLGLAARPSRTWPCW